MIPLFLATACLARGAEPPDPAPPPALTVHLSRPDRQLDRLLALFEGTRAPSPAAALAGWKRATRDPKALSKRVETALALLNPATARELRTLAGAEVVLGFDDAGRPRWSATVPGDDGTFAALATALALTDGAPEAPIGAARVDRLGEPGAPLMAQLGPAVVAAGTRADLEAALGRLPRPRSSTAEGLQLRLNSAALGACGPLPRRLAEALRATGLRDLEGTARLQGAQIDETGRDDPESISLALRLTGRPAGRPGAGRRLDLSWYDRFQTDRTLAAVALAIDPSPEAWDAAFAAADGIEKADPARAGLAPLRTRLNVLALAAGVRPEADLWPHLVGLTACVTVSPAGPIDGAVLALHADGASAADRIAAVLIPRLAFAARLVPRDVPPGPDGTRRLGRVQGRPLSVCRRGATVLLTWGEPSLPAEPEPRPGRTSGHRRLGAFWPGRLPGLPADSPLAHALRDARPVLWFGGRAGTATDDLIVWTGLHGVVRRFLDRLPMDPPPDRSTYPSPR